MPPFASYASVLDGSLRVISSSQPNKYGNGALLIENGCEFFGSTEQVLKTSDVNANLVINSAKDLLLGATGSFSVTGTTSSVTARTGDLSLTADVLDVKIVSTTKEALLKGKTRAYVNGEVDVYIKSDSGKTEIESGTTTTVKAATILTLDGPTVQTNAVSTLSLNASTTSTLDAITINVGGTASDTINISRAGKQTNILGSLGVTGACVFGNNVTIKGSLNVEGTTTTIDTEQILVKDNLMVLNSANAVGKDAGFLFRAAAGVTGSSFFWDESDSTFVLGLSNSQQDSFTVIVDSLAPIKCSTISTASFATKQFTLDANNGIPVSVDGIDKKRGAYEFQIESVASDGSVYNYKVVKNHEDSPAISFGVHAAGADSSQVWVAWPDKGVPQFYLKSYNPSATGTLDFKVKYLTV